MSNTAPTWGFVMITGLAGLAAGLLLAAVLVAGNGPRVTSVPFLPSSTSSPAKPVTVTTTAQAPPPITVTSQPPAETRTTTVTISDPATPPPASPTSLCPTGFRPDAR